MAAARITQLVVELLTHPAPPVPRVTQVVVETVTSAHAPAAVERVQPYVVLPV